jgi:hypothetical protein
VGIKSGYRLHPANPSSFLQKTAACFPSKGCAFTLRKQGIILLRIIQVIAAMQHCICMLIKNYL